MQIGDKSEIKTYHAANDRYTNMKYNRCGNSGVLLPAISLGLWHNFGGVDVFENGRAMVQRAFDLGITHIDIANNYGPPPGSAEETFGRIFREDLAELIVRIIDDDRTIGKTLAAIDGQRDWPWSNE